MTNTIRLSDVNSLPCVTFLNTRLGNDRKIFVCMDASEAHRMANELSSIPHIVDIEVLDSIVCGA